MADFHAISTLVARLKTGSDQLMGRLHAQEQAVADLTATTTQLKTETDLLTLVSTALNSLLKTVSVESLESVERLVTYGLQTIFDDQQIAFRIEVDTKRGIQSMEPRLIHKGVEAPILDTFGGGPAVVVSFLLRLMVCRRLGLAPVMLLDETFAMVSRQYVPNVAKLLRELSEKFDLTFILVTHQSEFLEYGHRNYEIKETITGSTFVERKA